MIGYDGNGGEEGVRVLNVREWAADLVGSREHMREFLDPAAATVRKGEGFYTMWDGTVATAWSK